MENTNEEHDNIGQTDPENTPTVLNPIAPARPQTRRWMDYLIQLSIVIIGIFVTLTASDMVNRSLRQRELRRTLELVAEELDSHLDRFTAMKEYVELELAGMEYFLAHREDISAIPLDSAAKHFRAIGFSNTFKFTSDAMEVLKSIGPVQSMRDKELLRDLFAAYNLLEYASGSVNQYYEAKREVTDGFYYTLDDEITRALVEENKPWPFLKEYIRNNTTRNFMRNSPGNVQPLLEVIESVEQSLRNILERLTTAIHGQSKTETTD